MPLQRLLARCVPRSLPSSRRLSTSSRSPPTGSLSCAYNINASSDIGLYVFFACSIEELSAAKKYIASVPALVRNKLSSIQYATDSFDLLDSFKVIDVIPARLPHALTAYDCWDTLQFRISKELFRIRWGVFSWPGVIEGMVQQQQLVLNEEKNVFLEQVCAHSIKV